MEVQSLTRKSEEKNTLHRSGPCIIEHMPEVFEALCAAPGEKVQEFNSHDISNTLWAIAKTGAHMLEVFAGLSVLRRVSMFRNSSWRLDLSPAKRFVGWRRLAPPVTGYNSRTDENINSMCVVDPLDPHLSTR